MSSSIFSGGALSDAALSFSFDAADDYYYYYYNSFYLQKSYKFICNIRFELPMSEREE
jgi:hypothetical protein